MQQLQSSRRKKIIDEMRQKRERKNSQKDSKAQRRINAGVAENAEAGEEFPNCGRSVQGVAEFAEDAGAMPAEAPAAQDAKGVQCHSPERRCDEELFGTA
jgi:hypothetical protein